MVEPRARTSFDGESEIRAPTLAKTSVPDSSTPRPTAVPAVSGVSSSSHSRQEVVSPPSRSASASTRSSQKWATGCPSGPSSTDSRRWLSTSATGTSGWVRTIARTRWTSDSGTVSPSGDSSSAAPISMRPSRPGSLRCQPSSWPPVRRRRVIFSRARRRSGVSK